MKYCIADRLSGNSCPFAPGCVMEGNLLLNWPGVFFCVGCLILPVFILGGLGRHVMWRTGVRKLYGPTKNAVEPHLTPHRASSAIIKGVLYN